VETLQEAARHSAAAPRRKLKLTLPAWPATDGVPRIIHQTFHTRELPPELADSLAAIRRGNPDWRHQFYDDADIRHFIDDRYGPAVLDYFDAINPKYRAARADFFRYLVVYAEGGVYLDAKSLPTRPLGEVIRPDDQFLISQWDNGPDGGYPGWGLDPEVAQVPGGEFQQWYVAAAAGHPFLRAVLERVLRNLRTYNPGLHGVGQRGVLRVTGPIAYTRAIHPLLERHPHRYVDSRADLGFEYSIYGKEGHKQAFGGHYSQLTDPITAVGPATRAAALAIGRPAGLRLHEGVGAALLERGLVGGPGLEARHPGLDVRKAAETAEDAQHLAHEAHLHVGGAELAEQPVAAFQRALHKAHVVGDLAVDARLQRRGRLAEPADVQLHEQRQHGRALGVMQPLVIGLVSVGAERRRQPAAAVPADQIVDDGPGLVDGARAVGDHRALAERVDRGEFRRPEAGLRIALIAPDLVGQAELFQQPQDALRARVVEVMDDDHGPLPFGIARYTSAPARRNARRGLGLAL
jgi:hypothetical protein